MSYRRSFNKRIAVHYSGSKSFSYPASQNGGTGTVHYEGTEYEDIQVNIDVETTPFENSVANCNNTVNLLTGAVVATETAQIVSIENNAKKVGSTFVEGFFKTIRSEISQQISELSNRLDATIIHLHEMAKRCIEKQKQMENDYNGLSVRYMKVFNDLNNELSNRVFELDKPVFIFNKQSESQNNRFLNNDLVSTVAIFGAEGADLQAYISSSIAKKRTLDTIDKTNLFLLKQKRLNNIIYQSMLKESVAAELFIPIYYIETYNENSQINKDVVQSDFLPIVQKNKLISDFQSKKWDNIPNENLNQIERYFYSEVNNHLPDTNSHTLRVKENVIKMLNINKIINL